MANPKPFVQAACICEKVLVEPDKVASLIRVVDTYFLELANPPNVEARLDLTIFVSLKSGDVTGYGRVVAVQDIGIRAADGRDEQPIADNRNLALAILKTLRVTVERWPSA
jgi:hypothetical protein